MTDISAEGVRIGEEFVPAKTVLWAAGVQASRAAEPLFPNMAASHVCELNKPNRRNLFASFDNISIKISTSAHRRFNGRNSSSTYTNGTSAGFPAFIPA